MEVTGGAGATNSSRVLISSGKIHLCSSVFASLKEMASDTFLPPSHVPATFYFRDDLGVSCQS